MQKSNETELDKMTDIDLSSKGDNVTEDIESTKKKLPYPKSVFFIVSNEFCERFMYYGMRAVLVLYLTRKLNYDDDSATVLYHAFTTLVYFVSIFGAILSDSWLGKFRTILILSIVYACGSIIISIGAIGTLDLNATAMTIVGLFLVALGSGGIKPCVAAFGGDQFKLPEQMKQMATFFSIFYFSINLGSFISTTVTPIFRQDVNCFGDTECYPLAFGVPGVLMVVSIAIFVGGRVLYKVTQPAGNMVVLVTKCIINAISTKGKEKHTNPREHWLDYAETKYGKQLVDDTKILFKILLLYIPLPIFWALFDQQGSRWTFQATRMTGFIGDFEIKPDQMQVFNPFLILIFIPLYDVAFYPLLAKVGLRRPLQKLVLGGILAGVAFLLSAFVELELEKTYPILPSSGHNQLRVFNLSPCNYGVTMSMPGDASETFQIDAMDMYQNRFIPIDGDQQSFNYQFVPQLRPDQTELPDECRTYIGTFLLVSGVASSFAIRDSPNIDLFNDDPNKSSTGDPYVRILLNSATGRDILLRDVNNQDNRISINVTERFYSNKIEVYASQYNVTVNDVVIGTYRYRQGGVNTMVIREIDAVNYDVNSIEISAPNSMHMLWLVPQYVVMTLGEVMYSVTGLQFSYAQAPVSMKSVIQSCWLLTIAFGNLIVVIVAGSQGLSSQAAEFFLFAGIMFAGMAVFAVLAWRYKGTEPPTEQSDTEAKTDDIKLEATKSIDNPGFNKDE